MKSDIIYEILFVIVLCSFMLIFLIIKIEAWIKSSCGILVLKGSLALLSGLKVVT